MKNRQRFYTLILCLTLAFAGCGTSNESASANTPVQAETTSEGHATVNGVTLTEGKYSEEKLDDTWTPTSSTTITLSSTPKTSDDEAVSISDHIITILKAGTYVLEGELQNGQLIIDTPADSLIKLVLNGVSLHADSSSAIYIKEGKTVITLADGTENIITDSDSYILENTEEEPDAAIFSKDDLSFNGTGSLTIEGNYKDAIKCKDDLKFISGTYTITACDDAIVGKDSVSIKDGTFLVTSEGDAIKATNAEETDKGYVMIDNGSISITSSGDGIVAETLLRVNDGVIDIESGNYSVESDASQNSSFSQNPSMNTMSNAQPPSSAPGDRKGGRGNKAQLDPNTMNPSDTAEETVSSKGIKSYVDLIVTGGKVSISSEDDAIHSDQNITIENGNFSLASNDDGIHAEKTLTIHNGTIDITQSYEGLEAFDIIINDGTISLVSSDDGINAAGDSDTAENPESDETFETDGTNPQNNFRDFRGAGGMMAAEDQGATLTINGGMITLLAEGDVIDINGDGILNGGTVLAHGPTMGGNGTLDYASSFDIAGGTFFGIGSAQMAMNPSSKTQGIIAETVQETISEGTNIIIKDESGNEITSLIVKKEGQWIGVSTSELVKGNTYTILIGDNTYSASAQ